MGSSNNPTNDDELLLSHVYNDLDVPSYKIKLQILLRIKSTNVITRKVNTGNYSNQNNLFRPSTMRSMTVSDDPDFQPRWPPS
jgi:hypothetical protein